MIALLTKSAQLLFIVRCNIAHSEKTPNGLTSTKSKPRDRAVSEVTATVIDDLFESVRSPNGLLGVYGTAPARVSQMLKYLRESKGSGLKERYMVTSLISMAFRYTTGGVPARQ